ncbi:MAG: oligosaccharide flippase family protein [Bacteroidia bacterium]|nr:oligosaccharide flippase family protein [Bacteroidia bacterium]
MKLLINKIATNNFYVLTIGTIASQFLVLATFFAIVKFNIYTPKEVGILNIVLNSVGILAVLFSLRYESAIAKSNTEEEAEQVFWMCIWWNFVFLFLFSSCFYFIPTAAIYNLGLSNLGVYVYLIPLYTFVLTINQLLILKINRDGNYKLNAVSKVLNSLLFIIILIVATCFFKNYFSVLNAQFFSLLVVTLLLLYKNKNLFRTHFDVHTFKSLSKKYIYLPKYFLVSSLFDKLSVNMPLLFINKIFDVSVAGYFGFSERILSSPSGVISSSISQILYQDVCKRINIQQEHFSIFASNLRKLFLMGILPFSILIIGGDYLAKTLLSEEWQGVGIYLQCIAAIQFIRFMVSPLSVILLANKETKILAIWQTSYFISVSVIIGVSYWYKNIKLFLILLVIIEFVLYSIYLYLIYKSAKKSLL